MNTRIQIYSIATFVLIVEYYLRYLDIYIYTYGPVSGGSHPPEMVMVLVNHVCMYVYIYM